jgi:predicted dehydrogenase
MGEIHAKALAKIAGVEIVSVAGRTEAGVNEFAARWKIPFGTTNLEAAIDRSGVDAVILTTPSDQHHDQTLLALSRIRTARSAGASRRARSTSTTWWWRPTSSAAPT